jgi:RNA polymerase sigma-70 factor, ECF subfamily
VWTVNVIVQDQALAQDIAQETFARAYLSWSKLWPEGNPGGWCHRVATNLAIGVRRRATREARAIAKLGRRTPLVVEAPEVYPELHAAVAQLPARQRAAVALHYVLGLSIDEAAEAMKCRPGTVKSLLFSARDNLRKRLGPDE